MERIQVAEQADFSILGEVTDQHMPLKKIVKSRES